MANFKEAFDLVIIHEGGYVNDPLDSGGETNLGITDKLDGKVDGLIDIDNNGTGDVAVSKLSIEDAAIIYRTKFWSPIKGDLINNQKVANSIFDFAVNAGVATSAKLAQRVVGVNDDGIIGTASIEAINSFDAELFIPLFTIAKVKRYIEICKKKETNKKFFFGWIDRTING